MITKIKIRIPGSEEAYLSSNGELRESDAALYEFMIDKAIETGSSKLLLDIDELVDYLEEKTNSDDE